MKSVTIVILGGTGDLAKKKIIPAINKLVEKNIFDKVHLVSTGRRPFSDVEYSDYLGVETNPNLSLHYFQADFTRKDSLGKFPDYLEKLEGGEKLFYLATSPVFFEKIARQLSKNFKNDPILIEKPFGYDLKSAKKLNKSLSKYYSEEKIFRVDHYLGKETVQNILVLRLSNPFFERTWNSDFIDTIKITLDEKDGVAERIAYYDTAGALRDVVQNHIIQVLSFLLMEPPLSILSEHLQKSKEKAINSLKYSGKISLGQYAGYKTELKDKGLPESNTETFAEVELESKNKRWRGTKIILKTGKHMKERLAKIEIIYKKEPCILYCDIKTHPNSLVLDIQPSQDISLFMNTKSPGKDFDVKHVKLNFSHEKEFSSNTPESYEIIIEEALKGDKTLFISDKELNSSWKLVDEIRKSLPKPRVYEHGEL